MADLNNFLIISQKYNKINKKGALKTNC